MGDSLKAHAGRSTLEYLCEVLGAHLTLTWTSWADLPRGWCLLEDTP
jgi:hypothetical protein